MDNQTPTPTRLDLSGEVCPYTFVKTKLALEDLSLGQCLQVFVDYQPSSQQVPRSVIKDGHQVLSVTQENNGWLILIQCGR